MLPQAISNRFNNTFAFLQYSLIHPPPLPYTPFSSFSSYKKEQKTVNSLQNPIIKYYFCAANRVKKIICLLNRRLTSY